MEILDIIAYIILFLVWIFGVSPLIGAIIYDGKFSNYKDAVHFGLVIQVMLVISGFISWIIFWSIERVLG